MLVWDAIAVVQTYVVASMLLSPLMVSFTRCLAAERAVGLTQCVVGPMQGPIIGCAFGFAIRDRSLFINGFVNEVFALVRESSSPALLLNYRLCSVSLMRLLHP